MRTRSLALVAAAALTAALAACSDDDTDSGSDATTEVTTEVTTADTTDAGTGDSTADTELDERLDAAADALRAGDFSRMLDLLELSGVADELEGREITILAPSDEAFDALSSDELQDLATNPTQIDDIIKRHVLDELLTYDELKALSEVTTMSGETLTVEVDGDDVRVGGALVTPPEDDAVSGEPGQEVAVFGIDTVLLESS
jgi:uncharacterized surface protein with fasciclin (FAS1) repeats